MASSSSSSSSGIGFLGLLTIVFIVLKLTGDIFWSWWWVLAPIWGGLAFWLAVAFLIFIGALIVASFRKRQSTKRINKLKNKR